MSAQGDLWRARRQMLTGLRTDGICKHCFVPIVVDAGGWRTATSYYCSSESAGQTHEPEDVPQLKDPEEVRAWLED